MNRTTNSLRVGRLLVAVLALAGARTAEAAPVASAAALVQRAQQELAAHPGRAVADFQRARLLAPRAPEVQDGLARARAAAGLPAATAGLRARLLGWLSPEEWSRGALVALAVAALAATAAAWRVRRRLTLPLAAAALAVALGAGAAAWRTAPRWTDAVVVAPNTVARIAPFAAAEPAFLAPEGSRATIGATHEGYVRIDGERGAGWVPSSAVEPILAPAPPRS
jgi:hypothetical protein